MKIQGISGVRREFRASSLRSQLNRLRGILIDIEEGGDIYPGYAVESLKEAEAILRQVRRICDSGFKKGGSTNEKVFSGMVRNFFNPALLRD